ncbi:MAG: hypothetical protein ACO3QM_05115 [Candidatus Nanopelagicaceae bacterium]
MAQIEVSWDYPQYTGYSILNAINPAVCWQEPRNNPLIKEFAVELYREEEDRWVDLGHTTTDYVKIDASDYDIRTSYQIRIATIGVNRRRSPWAYSQRYIASPLRFDFSTPKTIRLPDGQSKLNQRLLFMLF